MSAVADDDDKNCDEDNDENINICRSNKLYLMKKYKYLQVKYMIFDEEIQIFAGQISPVIMSSPQQEGRATIQASW